MSNLEHPPPFYGVRLWRGILTGACVAIVVLLIWWGNWFVGLRLRLTNLYYVPHPTTETVVLVAIDDRSLQALGSLLEWSREYYADLLTVLSAGDARVIAFDLLFAEPRAGDTVFAQAIAAARDSGVRIVLPVSGGDRTTSDDYTVHFGSELSSIPTFAEQANYLGYVNAFPDPDGTIRRQLSVGKFGETERFSFSLAAYLAYLDLSETLAQQVVNIDTGTITFPSGVTLATDENGLWLSNFFGNISTSHGGTFPVYSFADVINGDVDPVVFSDKIVLVGLMNLTGAVDRYPTPTTHIGQQMAGVEIQANAIETLLTRTPLNAEPRWSQIANIIALAIFTGIITAYLRWYAMFGAWIAILLIWGIYASWSFSFQHLVLNPFHPLLTVTLTTLMSIGVQVSVEVVQRQRAESILQSLVQMSEQRLALDRILPLIAADTQQLTGASAGSIGLIDMQDTSEELTFRHVHHWGDVPTKLNDKMSLQALETGTTQSDPQHLIVPIRWQQRTIGMIAVSLSGYRPGVRDQLEGFTQQIAANLDNALLYEQTQHQNIELAELNRIKTRMIRMASHDLKNPLGRITGYSEMLIEMYEEGDLTEEDSRLFLNRIMQASHEMTTIITEILNLEHIRAGKMTREPLNLKLIVQDVVERHRPEISDKQQILHTALADDLPLIDGDFNLIVQAVSNLVGNASKYTPKEGTIWVELIQRTNNLLLIVKDTGYGMPEDALSKLFTEFYRIRTEKTKNIKGTGLGLSLVKSIVEAHGGKIWVESELNVGSTFYVEFPISDG